MIALKQSPTERFSVCRHDRKLKVRSYFQSIKSGDRYENSLDREENAFERNESKLTGGGLCPKTNQT